MRISPVWFPDTQFKSILEPAVSNEGARVYHDNDQCSAVRFAHSSPAPYSGQEGLIHCFHCQQQHEREALGVI
jgi:hypothetical protein